MSRDSERPKGHDDFVARRPDRDGARCDLDLKPKALAHLIAADERLRSELADVLHGKVQGGLAAVVLLLAECRRRLAAGDEPGELDALLGEASRRLDAVRHGELEAAVVRLYPTALRLGLLPALDGLLEPFRRRFTVTLSADAETRALDDPLTDGLPPAIRLGAYRTVEAALQRAEKSAVGRLVDVQLQVRTAGSVPGAGERLWVCIRYGEDDGVGGAPDEGRGANDFAADIATLQLRVEAHGGRLDNAESTEWSEAVTAAFPLTLEG